MIILNNINNNNNDKDNNNKDNNNNNNNNNGNNNYNDNIYVCVYVYVHLRQIILASVNEPATVLDPRRRWRMYSSGTFSYFVI